MGFISVHFFLLLTTVLFFLGSWPFFPGPNLTHSYLAHFFTLIGIATTLVPYLLSPTDTTTLVISYPIDLATVLVATPLWPSVGVKPNTPKVGDLESSGTPKCLEFNNKAQNTSHWGVLKVIGKVLKLRYRKWPRIGHLSPKLWAKEGPGVKLAVWLPTTKSRESTFSRPLNWECNMALERSRRGLQLWFRPCRDQTLQLGVMSP
jgi:hypothetical protein